MKHLFIIVLIGFIGKIVNAQYTKLLDFSGTTNGNNPYGSLISDGTFLYGMTTRGGVNNYGTIFKIKPDGSGYVDLLDFAGVINGRNPYGDLIYDGTYLYGMTRQGGTGTCSAGCGVIFKIKTDGTGYSNLLDFAGANGSLPYGSLISDGTFLYGMTYSGGNGYGTVFRIKTDGTADTTLLNFLGTTNGGNPYGYLLTDATFLYGMTTLGGTNGMGTIYKIKTDGSGYSKLLEFSGTANGSDPGGALISDGNFLYGTTYYGGMNNYGTIFKIKPDGSGYTDILDFSGATNGKFPDGSLISYGSFLYGITEGGGANDSGTIFRIKPDGTGYSKLQDFNNAKGSNPFGSLISDGTFLYGMTYEGGINNMGTIFKFRDTTAPCTVSITGNTTICIGQSTTLTGSSGSNYSWSIGNTTASIVVSPSATTTYTVIATTGTCVATATATVTVQACTGISQLDNNNDFLVFPNPSSGKFTVQMNNGNTSTVNHQPLTIEVYNVMGEKVFETTNSDKQSVISHQPLNIDISFQPRGIYFLQIKTDQGSAVRKIVIQK
jgi:uncharacterized repeat protein (TIGR03803 family)